MNYTRTLGLYPNKFSVEKLHQMDYKFDNLA